MAITALLPIISTGLQMYQSNKARKQADADRVSSERAFDKEFADLKNFKYTDPQAYADMVAESEKIAGAAQQSGDRAIREGILQNIEAYQRDPRRAAMAAGAVQQGGQAAFDNALRAAQYSMPYRSQFAQMQDQTKRANEDFQRGLSEFEMQRAAGSAERARQEEIANRQEMMNAALVGGSQLVDVLNNNAMMRNQLEMNAQNNDLMRELYGNQRSDTEDSGTGVRSTEIPIPEVPDYVSAGQRQAQGGDPILISNQVSPVTTTPESTTVTLNPAGLRGPVGPLDESDLGVSAGIEVGNRATPMSEIAPIPISPLVNTPDGIMNFRAIDQLGLPDEAPIEENLDPYGVSRLSSVYQGSGPGSVFTGSTEGMVPGGMRGYTSLDPGFQQFSGDLPIGQGATLDDFRSEYRQDLARQNQIQSMLDMYNLARPRLEEGGGLPMMTPGEPSHETNEQRLIDKQTGAPIADLMGAETVLNDKQTAQIEKDLKEGDKDGLFKFMKKLFNKPQFKKQRAQNGSYKGRKDIPQPQAPQAPQAPGPGGMGDPRMAMMAAMMQGR